MVRSLSCPFLSDLIHFSSCAVLLTLVHCTGLTMINMQSAFLIVSKGYTEKQAGVLFFGKFFFCLSRSPDHP